MIGSGIFPIAKSSSKEKENSKKEPCTEAFLGEYIAFDVEICLHI